MMEKILNIEFGYFGITQSDDFLDSSQALYGHKSIWRQILQKILVSYFRERSVYLDMFLQNSQALFFLRAHHCAGLNQRLDKVLYDLGILLDKRLRAHQRAGRNSDAA